AELRRTRDFAGHVVPHPFPAGGWLQRDLRPTAHPRRRPNVELRGRYGPADEGLQERRSPSFAVYGVHSDRQGIRGGKQSQRGGSAPLGSLGAGSTLAANG